MSVCWPTAQLEAAKALYAQQHEKLPFHDGSRKRWAEKRSLSFPFHYGDGVTFWLAETEQEGTEDFLRPSVIEAGQAN